MATDAPQESAATSRGLVKIESRVASGLPSTGSSLRRLLGRIRWSFGIDTFDVFRRRVTEADRTFEPKSEYRFTWATADDIAECQVHHTELDERERREGIARLAMGHSCVIARAPAKDGRPGEIVFTMWMNPRNTNIPRHIKRKLGPHQAFIYKAFTSPQHRGRKLYEHGMRFVLAELARQGKTELLGYAHVGKTISRKGLAALEFESIGRFRRIRAGRFGWVLISRELAGALPVALRSSGRAADELLAERPE